MQQIQHILVSSLNWFIIIQYRVALTAKSNTKIDMKVNFGNIWINSINNIKFLGLTIDNSLSWNKQIEQLASKLSSAGYSIRSPK